MVGNGGWESCGRKSHLGKRRCYSQVQRAAWQAMVAGRVVAVSENSMYTVNCNQHAKPISSADGQI